MMAKKNQQPESQPITHAPQGWKVSSNPTACETCAFFHAISAAQGQCRRFPPAYAAHGGIVPTWPIVKRGDWCGEWKENPNA
jgi:hypothetical protein